jgi:hypothetical protein
MITFQITAEIKDDRRVVLTLPAEVPTGQTTLVVSVAPEPCGETQLQPGILDWVEFQAIRNGNSEEKYPLRGSVLRFDQPTEPVSESDWESIR